MEKPARRSFFKQTALAFGALGISPVLFGCSKPTINMNGKFVHHVFFWLKEPENESILTTFKLALEHLASIDAIKYKHIGTPAATNRPIIESTYTFSLLVVFDDEKGHGIYQEHPIHDEFREKYHDLWEKVLIFDCI